MLHKGESDFIILNSVFLPVILFACLLCLYWDDWSRYRMQLLFSRRIL